MVVILVHCLTNIVRVQAVDQDKFTATITLRDGSTVNDIAYENFSKLAN